MATLMTASHQWSSRPEDERFVGLLPLLAHFQDLKGRSSAKVLTTRMLEAHPVEDDERGLVLTGPNGVPVAPTHWAFGQLAARAGAPAGYLRDLPGPLAADCINHGLVNHAPEEIGVLLRKPVSGVPEISAVTGPGYGRIWNETIAKALVERFGDGLSGAFRVPGEFGREVEVTKSNTTIYGSDRDMFVFLADEKHRIDVPNRRNGKPGTMARGFFAWNSEVGAATFGIGTFLFDYVCCNRIVWGAEGYKEVKIRHTSGAPWRWVNEVAPALERYAESSTKQIDTLLLEARKAKIEGDVADWLSKRFTKSQARAISAAHLSDEGRPIETLWDAVTGATAYARSIPWQDERVAVERQAGKILDLAA